MSKNTTVEAGRLAAGTEEGGEREVGAMSRCLAWRNLAHANPQRDLSEYGPHPEPEDGKGWGSRVFWYGYFSLVGGARPLRRR